MTMSKTNSSSKILPPATPVYNSGPSVNIGKLPVSKKKDKKQDPVKNARGSPKMSKKVTKRISDKKMTENVPIKAELEKELMLHNYTPLEKIIIRDKGQMEKARYFKAFNKLGQTVFVDLDNDGIVHVNPKDLTVTPSNKSNMIPYSSKLGTMKCLDLDICGVAFECYNGICTLHRDQRSTTPIENTFVIIEGHISNNMTVNSDPIAFPIIRLSEIKNNPRLVLKTVNRATKKLRNLAHDNCHDELKKTFKIITELNKQYTKFNELQEKLFKNISSSIEILEHKITEIDDIEQLDEEDKKTYELLQYNIRLRNDKIVDLLNICKDVCNTMTSNKMSEKNIVSILEYLNNIIDYLENDPDFFSLNMDYLFE